jgi:hypothetical protein
MIVFATPWCDRLELDIIIDSAEPEPGDVGEIDDNIDAAGADSDDDDDDAEEEVEGDNGNTDSAAEGDVVCDDWDGDNGGEREGNPSLPLFPPNVSRLISPLFPLFRSRLPPTLRLLLLLLPLPLSAPAVNTSSASGGHACRDNAWAAIRGDLRSTMLLAEDRGDICSVSLVLNDGLETGVKALIAVLASVSWQRQLKGGEAPGKEIACCSMSDGVGNWVMRKWVSEPTNNKNLEFAARFQVRGTRARRWLFYCRWSGKPLENFVLCRDVFNIIRWES